MCDVTVLPTGRLNIAMVVHLNKMGLATIEGIWYITYNICDISHHLEKNCMLVLMIQAASNHIKENQLKLVSSVPG
jgi:type III secretory pathway component EscT